MAAKSPDDFERMVAELVHSRKYDGMGLEEDTVRDVLQREMANYKNPREALKAARAKLHNIVAPYLGDPDYVLAQTQLTQAFQTGDPGEVRRVCAEVMSAHVSTRERQPLLENFYQRIFAVTGKPAVMLDLACGLNPLSFPWMGLPASTRYYAYDIHRPRIDLLNHYFRLEELEPLALMQDILVHIPEPVADVALLLKEPQRLEQRQRGGNARLWDGLKARFLVISLPTQSLRGRYDLLERQRALVRGIILGKPWQVQEILFEGEIVFCIDKSVHV